MKAQTYILFFSSNSWKLRNKNELSKHVKLGKDVKK